MTDCHASVRLVTGLCQTGDKVTRQWLANHFKLPKSWKKWGELFLIHKFGNVMVSTAGSLFEICCLFCILTGKKCKS